jgi:site-specific DNA recombinase
MSRLPNTSAEAPPGLLRAAIYLRVSSSGQVRTDYDPEGLSLPAQRQGVTKKAHKLGAEVVREYVEPGVSGGSLVKRKAFRQMLEDIRERQDIDLVIVWSVSRWARDQEDHWTARGLINRAGAKLIAVKEPIGGDASHDVMFEGVTAAIAAGRRIEISEEVRRGVQHKAEIGGTWYRAPIGYLNVRDPLPGGGEVRTIAIDPERSKLVVLAFELYASGDYSVRAIADLLEDMGLTTRPSPSRPGRVLTPNRIQEILRNRYYIGKISLYGVEYEGRHDALVSDELFEQVQQLLDSKVAGRNHDRVHRHYLRGSLVCKRCGARMVYGLTTGRNGRRYPYFFCIGRQRNGTCEQKNARAELVEYGVEQEYSSVNLKPQQVKELKELVTSRIEELQRAVNERSVEAKRLVHGLRDRQRKLMEMRYEGLPPELFREEQAKLQRQIDTNELAIQDTESKFAQVERTMLRSIELSEQVADVYRRLEDENIRRLINQAVFVRLNVHTDDQNNIAIDSELTEEFAAWHDPKIIAALKAAGAPVDLAAFATAASDHPKTTKPGPSKKGRVSSHLQMVELGGLEPPTSWVRCKELRSPNIAICRTFAERP